MQELNSEFVSYKSRQRKLDSRYTPQAQFSEEVPTDEAFNLDDLDDISDTYDN